jgi:hypothetical protein
MDGLRRVVTACGPVRAGRTRRLHVVLLIAAVVVVSLALSGCVADPPPVIGTATAGDGQATVSWQAPLGAPLPITAYVVTPLVNNVQQAPVRFNSTATSETVTGLTNGTTYTFEVKAINALGNDSGSSAQSNPVTPRPAAGPELPVSDPVYGPNPSGQHNVRTAFDGTNYLAVWSDSRHGSEVWGTRVAPDGTVLDVGGIRISSGAGSPAVDFDGSNFLVVWATSNGISAVRVSDGGVVLDQTPIQIAASNVFGSMVSAGNGNSLVVWETCSPGHSCTTTQNGPAIHDVVGARISSDGTVLDPSPFTIASGMASASGFDVAFDGTSYLVAFGNITSCCPPQFPVQYGILAQRVSGAGTLVGSQIRIVSGLVGPNSPSLSFDGTNFFVVWSYDLVRGARVSPAGVLLDPSPFDISTAEGSDTDVPAVAFDGTNTIVAWQDFTTDNGPGTMLVRRVDGAGTPVDPTPIPVVACQNPALAVGNGQVLLAFANGFSLTTSLEAVRIAGGTILDNPPFVLSTHANDQTGPAVAANGTGSFVVWNDDRSGSIDVYGARVTADGSMLDGTGIPISTATGNQSSAAVVFDGTGYFVVWADTRSGTSDIYGARVTVDGVVLDPGGIQITSTPSVAELDPALAFDGTNYFVVWDQGTCPCGLFGTRVSTAGTVLDPGGITLPTTGNPLKPTVAFGSSSYLVAWQVNGGLTTPDIAAARVGTEGVALDPAPITISNGPTPESAPQVAFNGTNFLIVWEDQRNGSATDIYGARVSPAGTVLDPSGLAISTATDLQRQPHVAANAANGANGDFFVVWRDDRRHGAAANASDIFGARVTDAGVVRDPAGLSITNLNSDKSSPVVAPGTGANTWDVPYMRFAAGTQYGSYRVFHRSVTLN